MTITVKTIYGKAVMFKHAYYILFLESQEVGGEKKNGATQKGVQQDNDDHDDDQWEDCDDNQPQQHGTKARPCNENCRFAKKWATRMHKNLSTVDPDGDSSVMQIQWNIMRLEYCRRCYETRHHVDGCDIDTCTDMFRVLLSVQQHSPRIRSLIRRLYVIRRLNNWLLKADMYLNIGTYNNLRQTMTYKYVEEESGKDNVEIGRTAEHTVSEKAVIKQFGKIGKAYEKTINSHKLYCCSVCGVCRKKDNTRNIKSRHVLLERIQTKQDNEKIGGSKAEQLLRRWETDYNINIDYGPDSYICVNYCLADLKAGRPPRMHESNNLWVDDIPNVLSQLSETESFLIQKVKCFLTLVKLKALTKHRGPEDSILALRGVNIHVPLPLVSKVMYSNYY